MRSLWASGISTLSTLAKLDGTQVKGIGHSTLVKLINQARLQGQTYETSKGSLEVLPHQVGLGFDRLLAYLSGLKAGK